MEEFVVVVGLFKGIQVNKKHKTIYTPEWADKIYRGCRRNYEGDFKLVVVTDYKKDKFQEPVECVPFKYKEHSNRYMCLNEIFRPEMPYDRALFMGLDTIITGSIQSISTYPGDFGMVGHKRTHATDPTKKFGNAVTYFSLAKSTHLWEKYIAKPEYWDSTQRWSEDFSSEMLYWLNEYEGQIEDLNELYPKQIFRYTRYLPKECSPRIIYFVGGRKPQTHKEFNNHWI